MPGHHHFCCVEDFLNVRRYEPTIKPINEAAAIYLGNLYRVQSLARFPIILLGSAMTTQHFDSLARERLGISVNDSRLNTDETDYDPSFYQAKETLRKKMQGQWFNLSKTGEVPSGIDVGMDILSKLLDTGEPETIEGMDAVLKGIVTGAWTAFEVLVEMIWNAAVAERPSLKQAITTKEMEISGLRSTKRFRKLYEFTFRSDNAPMLGLLADDRIDALALTRNIIVHTGGKIDQEFDTRRGSIRALDCFNNVRKFGKVELTGPITKNLISPVVSAGFDLVEKVDTWIINHP